MHVCGGLITFLCTDDEGKKNGIRKYPELQCRIQNFKLRDRMSIHVLNECVTVQNVNNHCE